MIQTILNKIKYKRNPLKYLNIGYNNQWKRETWLEEQLKTIPEGCRILDAGAGEMQYKRFCGHLDYVSQDFAQYDGKGDEKGLHRGSWQADKVDIVSDITEIPEKNHSFDAILCVEVFEHIPEPIKAIGEFARLLKPGGTVLITAPFASLTHMAPYHFYSGFNRYFYEKHLALHGFEIAEIEANGNYPEYIAQELRMRLPNQYADITLKRRDKKAIIRTLELLDRMKRKDSGSEEMLCYGYHVKATRQ